MIPCKGLDFLQALAVVKHVMMSILATSFSIAR